MTSLRTESSDILTVLDAEHEGDYAEWLALWSAWPNREAFAHPGYVKLFARGIGAPKAAVMREGNGGVLYPFIVRSIPGNSNGQNDLISPYGYGGCFAWNIDDREVTLRRFASAFDTWAASQRIVSEFVRLSLFPEDVLEYPANLRERSANVVRSLDLDEEGLWRDYEAKVRKNVKKALRNNVRIDIDEKGDSLEAFHAVFAATMDRRDAASSYRYSLEFFQDLTDALRGHVAYVNAFHEDRIVSTELVLVSARAVYSFLGGTLSDSFDVRPNDLLKHELNLWARGAGKDSYVLGGGYQPNDGIFRYKKSFAPNGIVPFRTGERILDLNAYDALVSEKMQARVEAGITEPLDESFFPLYRAT